MRRLVLVLVLALLPAPAPGQTAPGLTPAIRLAWWTDAGFLTPFAVSILGPAGVTRLTLIYDTLVWKDGRGVIPWLAVSWRASPDGAAYVFTLRPDVRWHDGTPLTARDVRFSFEYYRRHPFRWIDTSVVSGVEVRDRRTVVIRLARRYAPFIENVAGTVPIIPEHVWQGIEHPEQEQTLASAVGSGPYRLAEYRPESGQYRLVAFDDYFRGRPLVREIQYLVIPQERQMLAVQSGQVDAGVTTTRDALALFAGIASGYERRGSRLSFGQDPRWRSYLVGRLRVAPDARVLDVATGTAAVAVEIARRYGCQVTGIDQSEAMLSEGRRSVLREGLTDRIELRQGEAERLPFPDASFDALTFTYLLRYVDDPAATLRELARVVHPGGVLASLEFGVPAWRPARAVWRVYTRTVVPLVALPMSFSWARAMRFLSRSVPDFWEAYPLADLLAMYREAGLTDVRVRRLTFGAGVVIWGIRDGDRPATGVADPSTP